MICVKCGKKHVRGLRDVSMVPNGRVDGTSIPRWDIYCRKPCAIEHHAEQKARKKAPARIESDW